MDIDQISKALDGLKQGLQNDGANLVVDNISNERVVVRLIVEDHACKECIVDSDVLTAVVEAALREIVPAGAVISLVDPRVKTRE